jgi:hypothetical protein
LEALANVRVSITRGRITRVEEKIPNPDVTPACLA